MTKVKTILAEFCSAKDILAINRLGLLKKEERESQPIPWRHRLPNAERRELVKSEMRMSLRAPRSRVNTRDKIKAFETAANPKDSRMGACLYQIHVRGDPNLSSNIRRIQRERSRLEASQEHSKHQFVTRSHSLNHEPLLLVERQPSQTVKTRSRLMKQHGVDPETLMKPSYMRPLQSRSKTPSTLATIDAFSAEVKKKRNVWEEAMDERDPPTFRSAARPYTRLNETEIQQLRRGHAMHKPRPDLTAKTTPTSSPSSTSIKSPTRPAVPAPRATTPPTPPSTTAAPTTAIARTDVADNVFITQQATTTRRSGATLVRPSSYTTSRGRSAINGASDGRISPSASERLDEARSTRSGGEVLAAPKEAKKSVTFSNAKPSSATRRDASVKGLAASPKAQSRPRSFTGPGSSARPVRGGSPRPEPRYNAFGSSEGQGQAQGRRSTASSRSVDTRPGVRSESSISGKRFGRASHGGGKKRDEMGFLSSLLAAQA